MNDEDVSEVYAYGANQIEGDVMIDTRENAKITLIDMAGDKHTTGGLSGSSNIFATYDNRLTILGGENDDDVDLTLDSDVEDGELNIDLGDDSRDTLNINLNGDEIDTRGFGRSIDHVEFVDIDAPDGDGEAYLEFLGSNQDRATLASVDMSDLSEDGGFTLNGDLSGAAGFQAITATTALALASFQYADAQNAGPLAGQGAGTYIKMIDGFVSEEDLEVVMTNGEDLIDLVIGESEFSVTLTAATPGTANDSLTLLNIANVGSADPLASNVEQTSVFAEGSGEVTIDLNGGDDTVSLVLGSEQEESVTLKFDRANSDDHDTVQITELEDLEGVADAIPNVAGTQFDEVSLVGGVSDLVIDFHDDITQIQADNDAVDANSVQIGNSSQGTLIVFGMSNVAVQKGFIFDHDGDGELSDGDTLVALTAALLGVGDAEGTAFGALATSAVTAAQIISTTTDSLTFLSDGLDAFEFTLSGGDLVA